MQHLKIFIELTRLNKPIGFMLLFWPCSWGLAYAFYFNQNINLFIYSLLKKMKNNVNAVFTCSTGVSEDAITYWR